MSTLMSVHNLMKSYEQRTLFSGVSMRLVEDDRLGIIGPNGAGKSTLLKVLCGLIEPDDGEMTRRRGLRLTYVAQDDIFAPDATPMGVVQAAAEGDAAGHRLDSETRAAITLSKLGFEQTHQPVGTLSGGWRKRLSIAAALVHEPEVLLLDEPTNHLDLEGTLWLEDFIRQVRMAVVFITHDRRFLENVARRIIELSPVYPDGVLEVMGNYTEFVRRKEEFLDAQRHRQQALANTVRRDTAWLRQGIQGRQTRNKSQVDDATARRQELKQVRARNDAPSRTADIDFQSTERRTRKLLALHNIGKTLGNKPLFSGIDLILSPGDRIGLLGANGSGKTTLLKILSGVIEPDEGTIKRAENLRVVSFTQDRAELIPTQTLQEALCPVGDVVEYRDRSMHVTAWAAKFLFTADQLNTLVHNLSGGERARVLLANLMLEPADVLLLDEPTNDLDIPSLEVLEEALLEFPGALVLVTHDRFMIERISTEFVALDGSGGARPFASLEQWQRFVTQRVAADAAEAKSKSSKRDVRTAQSGSDAISRKLSYREQREIDGMEDAILKAEARVEALQAEATNPEVLADHARSAAVYEELSRAQAEVTRLYDRWTELDALKKR